MITKYEDLPVGKYKQLVEIAKRGNIAEDEQNIAIVSILADMTEEEVERMPYVEMRALFAQAGFLYETPKEEKVKRSYQVGRFDCEVVAKPEKLTTAQYTNFKELASLADEEPEVVLSVFLVPKGKAYCEGYDIEELQHDIREHLPIGAGLAILAFFLRRLRRSTESMLIYSASLMKAATMNAKGEQKEMLKAKTKEMLKAIHFWRSGGGHITSTLQLGLPVLLGSKYTGCRASSS